jgi:hypothetical protein
VHVDSRRFSRLLVPVDSTTVSRQPLEFALALGELFASTVDVLQVWRTNTGRSVTSARAAAQQTLESFVPELAPANGVVLRHLLEHGDPYMTVSSVAELGGYGAIVSPGCGPDGALPRLSRALLFTCRVPSLLVPSTYQRPVSAPAIRRVLLAAASARGDSAAREAALSVSQRSGATLEVLSSDDQPALAARSARADYQLFVCSVPGGAFGEEVRAIESEHLIALQRCPVLALREDA